MEIDNNHDEDEKVDIIIGDTNPRRANASKVYIRIFMTLSKDCNSQTMSLIICEIKYRLSIKYYMIQKDAWSSWCI